MAVGVDFSIQSSSDFIELLHFLYNYGRGALDKKILFAKHFTVGLYSIHNSIHRNILSFPTLNNFSLDSRDDSYGFFFNLAWGLEPFPRRFLECCL